MTKDTAQKRITKAVEALNKAIVAGLKAGTCPEIEILGESEQWPEIQIQEWTDFPYEPED